MAIVSFPYHPDPAKCCEACAFGRGEHAPWCAKHPPCVPCAQASTCDHAEVCRAEISMREGI